MKARFQRSPNAPAAAPSANAPAYQNGLSRLARPAELADALGAPAQVVLLFERRLREGAAVLRVARGQALALVKRLGADLAHVIHAHQRRGIGARIRLELAFRDGRARGCAPPAMHARHGAQRTVEMNDQRVKFRHGPPCMHGLVYRVLNLILVHQKTKQDRADFEEIARGRVGERAPEIRVFVVDTKAADWSDPRFEQGAPTLRIAPMPIKRFTPPPGAVCQGHEFPKDEQYRRLARLGVPVPEWTAIEADTVLDPLQWGPYVVVKPALGRKGAEIFIKHAGRVRYRPGGELSGRPSRTHGPAPCAALHLHRQVAVKLPHRDLFRPRAAVLALRGSAPPCPA